MRPLEDWETVCAPYCMGDFCDRCRGTGRVLCAICRGSVHPRIAALVCGGEPQCNACHAECEECARPARRYPNELKIHAGVWPVVRDRGVA